MSVDVAVVGNPYLDLVFTGLPRLPAAGEEVVGDALHTVPGGTAIHAIGLSRLGLSVVLVSARGTDLAGELLRAALDREGVRWVGPEADRTATTAILSSSEGVAMATAHGGGEVTPEEVSEVQAKRVILSLGRAGLRPPGVPACFVTGAIEIEAGTPMPSGSGEAEDIIVMNADEARALTGASDPVTAARHLARWCETAVVTLGGGGAVGVRGEEQTRVSAPDVGPLDATGAGDIFVSALVWGAARGLPLREMLGWACLSAGVSVTAPPALEGTPTLDELLEAGKRRGLTRP
jgi:sugar/nucleoside kinase (ribokinase family)